MTKENNVYKKPKSQTDKMSQRIYSSAKASEPWYLKMIFIILIVILFAGGSIASFFIIKKQGIANDALEKEIDITEKLMIFENNIMKEREKIGKNNIKEAQEIAKTNNALNDEINDLLKYYFKTFNDEVEGYNTVIELAQKFETLSDEFFELNKDVSRLLKNNQTQPY